MRTEQPWRALNSPAIPICSSRGGGVEQLPREIDDFAARILMPVRANDTEIHDEIESSIGNARRVSSALGASMLPSYPIFNAVITGLLSIPFENFVSRK
jgi:hypothetical protein